MIDDVDELLALRAGDKYRLNDIRRRLEIYKRLYISDLEFLRNLAKTYLDRDLSPEPRRPKPGEIQTGSGSCSSCGSQIGADEAFCTNCGAKKAGPSSPPTSYVPEPEPSAAKPMQVQTGTGKKSRQQELDEYERQYLSKSGIKAGAEGFAITEDGEVGEITKKKPAKPKKTAKKTTKKTRKPRKKKETDSSSCVKCGSKIATDDMFCTNCGSKR
jgi:hypothetical protein